jgi:hypothetical protein
LKAGKFYTMFGKHNLLHTHAFPFLDAPLVNVALLGDEGLNEAGASASYLLPTSWFSELTYQALGNFRSLAHLKNLVDLDDDSTLELGLSGLTQWAWAVDLTFKHRPTDRGQGRRFVIAGEYLSGLSPTRTRGFYTYVQYEFSSRAYIQYRFDDLLESNSQLRHGFLLGYAPSEFSVFRAQVDTRSDGVNPRENRFLLQTNISIGAHPAHEY